MEFIIVVSFGQQNGEREIYNYEKWNVATLLDITS